MTLNFMRTNKKSSAHYRRSESLNFFPLWWGTLNYEDLGKFYQALIKVANNQNLHKWLRNIMNKSVNNDERIRNVWKKGLFTLCHFILSTFSKKLKEWTESQKKQNTL